MQTGREFVERAFIGSEIEVCFYQRSYFQQFYTGVRCRNYTGVHCRNYLSVSHPLHLDYCSNMWSTSYLLMNCLWFNFYSIPGIFLLVCSVFTWIWNGMCYKNYSLILSHLNTYKLHLCFIHIEFHDHLLHFLSRYFALFYFIALFPTARCFVSSPRLLLRWMNSYLGIAPRLHLKLIACPSHQGINFL